MTTASRCGPRHWGQSSAGEVAEKRRVAQRAMEQAFMEGWWEMEVEDGKSNEHRAFNTAQFGLTHW
jgi:hypothetical protein